MRINFSLLSIVSVTSIALLGGASLAKTTVTTRLPLGDNKYVTNAPKSGYIYLCNVHTDNAGAFQDGPWIQGTTWDPAQKIAVGGHVAWPAASMKVTVKDGSRVISTNALPSHTSGVYPIASSDAAYQYDRNPNAIKQQTLSVSVPSKPVAASSAHCMGGEVGIALTGVPIFNGFDAGMRDAVAHELQDSYNGHPQVSGEYHYHNISDAVTQHLTLKNQKGPVLIGYAYDGFGIYSGVENGKTLTNADLDACHGHVSRVMWDGKMTSMYHYSVTKEFPYTVGCFKGTPVQNGPSSSGMPPNGGMAQSVSGQQQGAPQGGPPAEALAACSGKQTGASCQFTDTHGSHSGTCQGPQGMAAACHP